MKEDARQKRRAAREVLSVGEKKEKGRKKEKKGKEIRARLANVIPILADVSVFTLAANHILLGVPHNTTLLTSAQERLRI